SSALYTLTHLITLSDLCSLSVIPNQQTSTLFPYTTLFRSSSASSGMASPSLVVRLAAPAGAAELAGPAGLDAGGAAGVEEAQDLDRKSTRLNSSHVSISYAVFCLKKKWIRVTFKSKQMPT